MIRDNRGTAIKVGQEVVCNVSGQVAKGTIEKVVDGYRYNGPSVTIHVKLAHSAAGKPAGHISKIAHPRNVLVLNLPSCPNCGQSPLQGES